MSDKNNSNHKHKYIKIMNLKLSKLSFTGQIFLALILAIIAGCASCAVVMQRFSKGIFKD